VEVDVGSRGLSNSRTANGVSGPTRAELPPSSVPMRVVSGQGSVIGSAGSAAGGRVSVGGDLRGGGPASDWSATAETPQGPPQGGRLRGGSVGGSEWSARRGREPCAAPTQSAPYRGRRPARSCQWPWLCRRDADGISWLRPAEWWKLVVTVYGSASGADYAVRSAAGAT
jgi:hypothetical protein